MHTELHHRTARFCSLFVSLVLIAGTAMAADVVSTNSGNWEEDSTWDPAVPGATDDVFIDSGDTVTINGLSTLHINSLSVSGVLEHADNSTEPATDKIILSITNDCIIAAGGEIDVMGKGFTSGNGPGTPATAHAGASHGGIGSVYNSGEADLGPAYGSVYSPTNLGSGGASAGASGGGAVRLDVGGACTVDGTINADGKPGSSYTGGSGGSVYITCATFAGSGTISADGERNASRSDTGGGGGGRIAVVLTNGSSFGSVTMTAYFGVAGNAGRPSAGTIFTKTESQTYGTLKVDNNGYGTVRGRTVNQGTEIPPGESWQFDAVAVTNGGNLWIPTGTTLTVPDFSASHTSGYVTVEGTLDVSDDFTLTNLTLQPLAGCTLALTDLTIASGARVTHSHNNQQEVYSLEIDIPGNLTVQAGGRIDVVGKGYSAAYGPGAGSDHGGGGYGGEGGDYQGTTDGGSTYGSITCPTNLGSGGASDSPGGGAIRLIVGGTLTNNGVITADGLKPPTYNSGAGGSVWITTDYLAGSGTISANGGAFASRADVGSGAGGRISIVLTSGTDFEQDTIEAHAGWANGAAGTVYLKDALDTYGELIIDNNNLALPGSKFATTRIHADVSDTVVGNVTIRNEAWLSVTNCALTVHGDWTNSATFFATNNGVVVLGGTGSATVYGNTTFENLTCTNAGKTVNFQAGATNTVTGTLTVTGAEGNRIDLNSTSQGSYWYLGLPAGSDHSVSFVEAEDSYATVNPVIADDSTNVNDSCVNWLFGGGTTNTWLGDVSTDWATAANWDQPAIPSPADAEVRIPNGAPLYPLLDGPRTVHGDLVIGSGASLDLNSKALTVVGDASIAGTLIAQGSETITFRGNVDFTGSGQFTNANSTVVFGGGSTQLITSAGDVFYDIQVTNNADTVTFADAVSCNDISIPNSGSSVRFNGDVTAREFSCQGPSSALTFVDGVTCTFTNMLLRGSGGNLITLRSSGGTDWNLKVSGWHYVRYVDAEDSNASGGKKIYAINSTGADNTNWEFASWHVWEGTQSGDFSDPDNWSETTAPDSTTMVVIDGNGGNSPVISAPVTVKRLSIGKTTTSELTISAALAVQEDVFVFADATLKHGDNSTAETYKLNLTVAGDLKILAGGAIDVTGLGYDEGYGPGLAGSYCGGCYGGVGGQYQSYSLGKTYGSILTPTNCGSGSLSGGDNGGGAIRLNVTGATLLNGSIVADGNKGTGYPGGSGGSIYLTSGTLEGSGTMRAGGGNSGAGHTANGGGGRIAVVLTGGTTTGNVTISARGGTTVGGGACDSAPGTIYLETTDDASGAGTVIIHAKGEDHGQYTYIPAQSNAVPEELSDATISVEGESKVRIAGSCTVASLSVASTDESLDLGESGTVLSLKEMTINGTTYTSGGTYTTNDWNGFATPSNVTGDGEIQIAVGGMVIVVR